MMDARSDASTRVSRIIKAPCETIYDAFINPKSLVVWLPPAEMTGKIYEFDARVGGGYQMSLFYPASERMFRGKTSEREDRFTARFVELDSSSKIVQAVTFHSDDPAFSGEMTMEVRFEPENGATQVIIECRNIPPGIRPEDNEAGCRSSLEKLARFVE
jgi:uncharacterized protein YndB with AHSA1/START domain